MKPTILTVVGARPQFIKAAPLSAALRSWCREVLVHTGQHFDPKMSDVFFSELALPMPDHHLELGGGTHGRQTGRMLEQIEEILIREKPHAVLVYGDTNSTLAGALAAAKLHIPIAHVEAGLRSFNRKMPEEVNRVLTDQLSSWLFVPSESSTKNLNREGITQGVYDVGDVMLDILNQVRASIDGSLNSFLSDYSLEANQYFYLTLHRAENVDHPERLKEILSALSKISHPMLWPLHPRTKARLEEFGLELPPQMRVIEPVGYLDSLRFALGSALVFTDSGGLQKEAYFLDRPCITLRAETEWIETLSEGWNQLVDLGALPGQILAAQRLLGQRAPSVLGDGRAAAKISEILRESLSVKSA